MKTVLFVPGFQEDITSRNYTSTITAIKKQGYKVKFIPINWFRTTIEEWVDEFNDSYKNYDPKDTILAGFSYGAMTVFMAATMQNPSELWLFSLSPYFAEDLKSKNMKATWLKEIGYRRVTTFGRLHFEQLAKMIECKTFLFVGQLEIDKWPVMGERSMGAHKLLKDNELTIVQESGHDVANPHYIEAIQSKIV